MPFYKYTCNIVKKYFFNIHKDINIVFLITPWFWVDLQFYIGNKISLKKSISEYFKVTFKGGGILFSHMKFYLNSASWCVLEILAKVLHLCSWMGIKHGKHIFFEK